MGCLALGLCGESVERSVSADQDGEPGRGYQAIMRILQKGNCAVKLSRRLGRRFSAGAENLQLPRFDVSPIRAMLRVVRTKSIPQVVTGRPG